MISHGYVARIWNGEYLVLNESTTHTGTHRTVEHTSDIERATIFNYPYLTNMQRRFDIDDSKVTFLPVCVSRVVCFNATGYAPPVRP